METHVHLSQISAKYWPGRIAFLPPCSSHIAVYFYVGLNSATASLLTYVPCHSIMLPCLFK